MAHGHSNTALNLRYLIPLVKLAPVLLTYYGPSYYARLHFFLNLGANSGLADSTSIRDIQMTILSIDRHLKGDFPIDYVVGIRKLTIATLLDPVLEFLLGAAQIRTQYCSSSSRLRALYIHFDNKIKFPKPLRVWPKLKPPMAVAQMANTITHAARSFRYHRTKSLYQPRFSVAFKLS